jgi:hypothetical protein
MKKKDQQQYQNLGVPAYGFKYCLEINQNINDHVPRPRAPNFKILMLLYWRKTLMNPLKKMTGSWIPQSSLMKYLLEPLNLWRWVMICYHFHRDIGQNKRNISIRRR